MYKIKRECQLSLAVYVTSITLLDYKRNMPAFINIIECRLCSPSIALKNVFCLLSFPSKREERIDEEKCTLNDTNGSFC